MNESTLVTPAHHASSRSLSTLKQYGRRIGLRRLQDILNGRASYRSESTATGLRRDLTQPFTPTEAKIPIQIREIRTSDFDAIFDLGDPEIDEQERALRKSRRELAETGIGRGYVAATSEDEPCYVQWLFGPNDNNAVHRYFEGTFPPLEPGEALLEGAFTPAHFRGKGIMSAAMARIAERAADDGAQYVITFVGDDNAASLVGCNRAGFYPYASRTVRWSGLRRTVRFRYLFEPVSTPGERD